MENPEDGEREEQEEDWTDAAQNWPPRACGDRSAAGPGSSSAWIGSGSVVRIATFGVPGHGREEIVEEMRMFR